MCGGVSLRRSLPEVRVAGGAGGDVPSSDDVVWDNRF